MVSVLSLPVSMRLAVLGDFKVGDLVCYSYQDNVNPIRLMAIVLECCDDGCQYKIQFTDDGSQMFVNVIELSPVDTLLSYPDTPQ